MKKLKFLIVVSILNIGMFHFNVSWTDFFDEATAYSRTGDILGGVITSVLKQEIEKKLEDKFITTSLVLENKENSDVIIIRPESVVMINGEETKYKFKSYSSELNLIRLKSGALEFEYDLSNIDYISIILDPEITPLRTLGVGAASILGGMVGFGVGTISGSGSSDYHQELGGQMLGCTIGMFAGPILYTNNLRKEKLDIYLSEWTISK